MKNLIPLFIFTTMFVFGQNSKMNQQISVKSLTNNKTFNNEIMLLSEAEVAPIFVGCDKFETNIEKTNCLITNLNIYTTDKIYKSDLIKNSKLKKKIHRARVLFVIDQNGSIKVKCVLGGFPKEISKEIKTIVESAPKLTPARDKNNNIPVKFSVKIPFNLK